MPLFALVAAVAALRPSSATAQGPTSAPRRHAAAPITVKESAALREQARAALACGDLAAAERLIERARPIVTSTERTQWILIEAELEFALKRFSKSALAAMQIVILHPKSAEVGPALYWAARSYDSLGRPEKAVALYEECLANKKTPKDLRSAAAARVPGLKTKLSANG
jgi:tetratricopeptide (TPR) repeat protein